MNMEEEKDDVCLLIIDTNEDGILISRPFCTNCTNKKLELLKIKVIKFCKISNKEAKEMIDIYKGLINPYLEVEESKKKKSKYTEMQLRSVRIKCECNIK